MVTRVAPHGGAHVDVVRKVGQQQLEALWLVVDDAGMQSIVAILTVVAQIRMRNEFTNRSCLAMIDGKTQRRVAQTVAEIGVSTTFQQEA